MKNRFTGQFTGNIRQIFEYLLTMCGKIPPSQLNDFEKKVTGMPYYPVTLVKHIFNKVEDPLRYGDIS